MHPNNNEPDQIRWVPVVSKTGKPLMPCHPARARKLIAKGTLCFHPKHGQCLVGGNDGVDRVSLHALLSGSRLCKNAKSSDLTLMAHSPWVLYDSTLANRTEKKASRRQITQTRYILGVSCA